MISKELEKIISNNDLNINEIISNKNFSVWTEVPDGPFSIKDERENIFKSLEDVVAFIQGKVVKNYSNKELQIKANERIATIEMSASFDKDKLIAFSKLKIWKRILM